MIYLSTKPTENNQSGIESIKSWVVDYYGQRFYLTNAQRAVLLQAKAKGESIIQIDQFTLSTSFSWLAPIEELESNRLSTEETMIIAKICQWIDRPIHELSMNSDQIYNYAVKIVKRWGSAKTISLFEEYANGEYPSVKGFMSAVKQLEYDEDNDIIRQSRIGTTNGFKQIADQ